jgi:hypothetical protein
MNRCDSVGAELRGKLGRAILRKLSAPDGGADRSSGS